MFVKITKLCLGKNYLVHSVILQKRVMTHNQQLFFYLHPIIVRVHLFIFRKSTDDCHVKYFLNQEMGFQIMSEG